MRVNATRGTVAMPPARRQSSVVKDPGWTAWWISHSVVNGGSRTVAEAA